MKDIENNNTVNDLGFAHQTDDETLDTQSTRREYGLPEISNVALPEISNLALLFWSSFFLMMTIVGSVLLFDNDADNMASPLVDNEWKTLSRNTTISQSNPNNTNSESAIWTPVGNTEVGDPSTAWAIPPASVLEDIGRKNPTDTENPNRGKPNTESSVDDEWMIPPNAFSFDFLEKNKNKNNVPCEHKYILSSSNYGETGDLIIQIPPKAEKGDLLLLFLSRSDDTLPLELEDWTTGPSCFKEHNGQQQCWSAEDCVVKGSSYCKYFPKNHTGRDLATVIFYRTLDDTLTDKTIIALTLGGRHPAWAILAAIPGVNTLDPIRDSAGASCDRSRASIFPTVYGEPGDIVLLHMAFDDATKAQNFTAPNGTEKIQDVHGYDEAGFLFGQRWDMKGRTPMYQTLGGGGSGCKDELLSVVIRGSSVSKDSSPSTLLAGDCVEP